MKYVQKIILFVFLLTCLELQAKQEFEQQSQLTLEKQELLKPENQFYEALGFKESSSNPNATNNEGAIGKYQILQSTLKELGYNITLEEFKKNPNMFPETLQTEALNKKILKDLKVLQKQWFRKDSSNINYLSLIGDTINGIPITLSGLVASCHIGGVMGTIKFIDSLGKYNPGDTNRSTIGSYMKEFSGYNLTEFICLEQSKNYTTSSIPSTSKSKSYIMEQKSQDTETVLTYLCHSIKSLELKKELFKQYHLISEYRPLCQSITEQFLISEAPLRKPMEYPYLVLEKSSGIIQRNGTESW